jgi:hypothetical protein
MRSFAECVSAGALAEGDGGEQNLGGAQRNRI